MALEQNLQLDSRHFVFQVPIDGAYLLSAAMSDNVTATVLQQIHFPVPKIISHQRLGLAQALV
jgi:hypothetical protein